MVMRQLISQPNNSFLILMAQVLFMFIFSLNIKGAAVASGIDSALHAYRKSVPDLVGLATTQANKAREKSESGS